MCESDARKTRRQGRFEPASGKSRGAIGAKATLTIIVVCCVIIVGWTSRGAAGGRTGKLLWKFPTSEWVVALALGDDGTIYAGSWGGKKVYALTPQGALSREFEIGKYGGITALGVGKDGTVYADAGFMIYAFDPASGATKWSRNVGWPIFGPLPVGSDSPIFHGRTTGEMCTFGGDGTPKMKFETGVGIQAWTLGEDGTIYVEGNGLFLAFDRSGGLRWESSLSARSLTALTVGRGGVLFAGGRDHYVYAIVPSNVHHKGSKAESAGAKISRRPALTQIAPSFSAHVTVMSVEGGFGAAAPTAIIKWSFKTRGTPFAIAQRPDGVIYVGSYDGNIYALDPGTGALKWRFSADDSGWGVNPIHALVVAKDGVIYLGAGRSVEAIKPFN